MTKIAFYGLGSMGFGMAESLLRGGLSVTGHDVNEDALTRFRNLGGGDTATSAADIIIICVVNAAQTATVLDSILTDVSPGAVVISCANGSP